MVIKQIIAMEEDNNKNDKIKCLTRDNSFGASGKVQHAENSNKSKLHITSIT